MSDENEMIGSLIILDINVLEYAKAWSEDGPYVKAGLFERVEFIIYNKVIYSAIIGSLNQSPTRGVGSIKL